MSKYKVELTINSPEYSRNWVTVNTKAQAIAIANMACTAIGTGYRFKENAIKKDTVKIGWENAAKTHFISIKRE
jgi:hypothetical protein